MHTGRSLARAIRLSNIQYSLHSNPRDLTTREATEL